ncbi:hypothetical protein FSP39_002035 [Pinctada imbricata]|uniref:Beta-1,3-galactosyl-O-glycosyl-glycoprotein beta-1,6-N-acetylglucosaminyltransferase n=1 Tax=Pinctada imbricata TaxID=66713 RepID=A0AA88XPA9_PINIB|nr:hypothetical protein FSP39_002035 [Pinctada imbricata]
MRKTCSLKQIFALLCVTLAVVTLSNILSSVPVDLNKLSSLEVNLNGVKLDTKREVEGGHIVGPKKRVYKVSCAKVIEGDKTEITKAQTLMRETKSFRISDESFINLTRDCQRFRESRDYDTIPVSKEELEFPIAYNLLLYRDVDQTERLLRAIYRKQNIYCLHVDASASLAVRNAMAAIAGCLKNVFMVSHAEDVIYEGFSRLKADLNCMEDLMKKDVQWKYLINIPSQQFPLKTNLEIVKILKIYNGSNDIEGITVPGRMYSVRYKFKHKMSATKTLVRTSEKKEPPPHNITLVKGSAYGVFSRAFVKFILEDKMAHDLLEWTKEVRSPDEYYWATLNHNKVIKAPGSYTAGIPDKKPWLAVYAAWGGANPCHGKFVRGVCVFGVEDLNELVSKKELFLNKLYIDYQPLTMDCLEEYIYNKSFSNIPFKTFYYKNLPFVRKS